MSTGLLQYMWVTWKLQRQRGSTLLMAKLQWLCDQTGCSVVLLGSGRTRRSHVGPTGPLAVSCARPWAQSGSSSREAEHRHSSFITKLLNINKSKVWSFLFGSFHCTSGNKHVTYGTGKLSITPGFARRGGLDVVCLVFTLGRADIWRQLLYSYLEFLEILSHHIGLCDKTKQKILWSATYISRSFPWRESVSLESWDQSNCKPLDRKRNCRKLHGFFYFIQGNGQSGKRNKGKMEVALQDKWLQNLHIWKNKLVYFFFFLSFCFFCLYSMYLQ